MGSLDLAQGVRALNRFHLVAFAQDAQTTPDDYLLVVNDQYPGAHGSLPLLVSA